MREINSISLEVIGRMTVPDAVTNAVVFASDGKRVFVPTYMNEVYAFDRMAMR